MSNKTVQEKVDSAAQALLDLADKLRSKNSAVVTVVEPTVDFDGLDLAVREIRALVDGEEVYESDVDGGAVEPSKSDSNDAVTTPETEPVVEEVKEVVTEEVTEQTESVSIS